MPFLGINTEKYLYNMLLQYMEKLSNMYVERDFFICAKKCAVE